MRKLAWAIVAIGGLRAQDMTKCPDYARSMKLLDGRMRVQSSITINRQIYAPLEQIGVTLTIQNPFDRELEIPDPEVPHHCGMIGLSQLIPNANGEPQWHAITYCEDRTFPTLQSEGCPTASKSIVLAPKATKALHFTFRAPETEGTYLLYGQRIRASRQFEVKDTPILAVAEIQRTRKDRHIPTMSRAAVIETADGLQALMLSILPDWDSSRFHPSFGNGLAARSGTFHLVRRIATDRRSITNLQLAEDTEHPDILIVTFQDDGVTKTIRFNANYEEIR